MNTIIILCFLFTVTPKATSNSQLLSADHISINCGSTASSTSLRGREWIGDFYPILAVQGSSTTSTADSSAVDRVPYSTARISGSRFSYTFHHNPGQKIIRLHFNPASYKGFRRFHDFFTVEAGRFTLLANFSASIASVNSFAKEFCVIIPENQPFNIVFTPSIGSLKYAYAFINGIEIISVPSSVNYCHYWHGENIGVQVVGYIDNTTALELVHRQNIKWGSVSSSDDVSSMFGMWATTKKLKGNRDSSIRWRISVDVGFRYLVRVHFCELGLRMVEAGRKDFKLVINETIVSTSDDLLQERGSLSVLLFKNYMVIVEGQKQEGKRDILLSLQSDHVFDRHGPLEGFEVFKLSNHDYSLASPNPLLPKRDSPLQPIQILLSLLGRRNALATVVFAVMCLVNIIVYMLQQTQGANFTEEEENKPSPRAKRLCRRFSLAEIQLATDNFFDAFVIGKGGFGKVYKGLIDNGRETVAIKRLKPDSKQGKREFWAEVETLSELRHVNLVSLIGYCNEQPEMILVYEYMPCGTLADHLYKLARKNIVYHPLSWKQRLQICIGAGRGLDYLHRGLENEIIHRDMKASNILLDENFVAKVSDFGLAKIKSRSKSQNEASTNLKGTFGYIDPDYFRTHRLTIESDTYSFGVVLLEVLCGRPAVESWAVEDKRSLTMWARDNIAKGEVDHIIDPSLREEISPDSLKTFLRIAEKCLLDEPKKRPAIAHVVMILEFALEQQDHTQSLVLNERARIADIFPSTDQANPRPAGQILPQPNLRVFTFKELKTATRNFRSNAVLGEGGFGKVYKGWLDEITRGKPGSWTVIAVKKLNSESMQGFEEWQSEVNFLGRLSHRNLVRLLGYSWEDKELLLVYEFMQKGSLENHLFGRGSSVQPLPWNLRLKILIGAAHGLAFLHALDRKVIYRDFKASNILLDGSYHAKISDFGLAKLGPTASKSHVTTQVMGTHGYAAPEYVATGHLYVKSDVYAFGVVLVEMLTGLRAHDTNRPAKQQSLADWIKPHLSERRKLEHIIDSRLEGRFPSRSAFQVAQLALNCLQSEPKMRPSMQEVVEILEKMDLRVHFT